MITIGDKVFKIYIDERKISKRISKIAKLINIDYKGRNPLFLVVLNGAFMFASEIMRRITIPYEISFVKLSSYQGTTSLGKVKEVIGLNENMKGRDILIIEDIIESGLTVTHLKERLEEQSPKSINVCALLLKPNKLICDPGITYCAFVVPDDFLVGFGLDYNGQGRGLRDLYSLCNENDNTEKKEDALIVS